MKSPPSKKKSAASLNRLPRDQGGGRRNNGPGVGLDGPGVDVGDGGNDRTPPDSANGLLEKDPGRIATYLQNGGNQKKGPDPDLGVPGNGNDLGPDGTSGEGILVAPEGYTDLGVNVAVDVDIDPHYDIDYHHQYPEWCVPFGNSFGLEYGFVFCGSCVGSCHHTRWYYRSPGYLAYYHPFRTFFRPSCYFLPAYYPTYSSVVYVTETIADDADYFAPLPSSEPIDPTLEIEELLNLGWDLFYNGDYAGAAESFRQAMLKDGDDPWIKLAFAQALFAIGDYPDAAFLLRRGMQLLPDYLEFAPNPLDRYGDVLDHAEQILALRTFLEYLPEDPAGMLMLGVQSFLIGDFVTAEIQFSRLLELDPEDVVAQTFWFALPE